MDEILYYLVIGAGYVIYSWYKQKQAKQQQEQQRRPAQRREEPVQEVPWEEAREVPRSFEELLEQLTGQPPQPPKPAPVRVAAPAPMPASIEYTPRRADRPRGQVRSVPSQSPSASDEPLQTFDLRQAIIHSAILERPYA